MSCLLALGALAAMLAGNPVGTYTPDLSGFPGNSSSAPSAYFQGLIRVSSDGSYLMEGTNIEGFWRRHGEAIVFTNPSFFRIKAPLPNAVVRKHWPSNLLEGMVWRPGPNGTWTMRDFGRVRGVARFRPVNLSTEELLRRNDREDPDSIIAFATLSDEAPLRLDDLERAAAKSKDDFGAFLFLCQAGPQGRSRAMRLLSSSLASRRYRGMTLLSRHVEGPEGLALLSKEKDARIQRSLVVRLGELRHSPSISVIRSFLTSADQELSNAATVALARMNAPDVLSEVEVLSRKEPEEFEEKDHYALLAYLVRNDPKAQSSAMRRLLDAALDKHHDQPFGSMTATYAVEALTQTKHAMTVPHLVTVLENAHYLRARGAAARALARLRARSAVPALLEAKASFPSEQEDGFYDPFYFRYEVIEALWEMDNGPDPHSPKEQD